MSGSEEALYEAITDVVSNDNCSGCGVCAGLFSGIQMTLSDDGFMRPALTRAALAGNASEAHEIFDMVCPGRRVSAPLVPDGANVHPIFGRNLAVWEGWSTDPEIRHSGSSGGVLTTISLFLSQKTELAAQMVAMDVSRPTRSVPVRIMSRDEALEAAGSRYAPVSVGADEWSGTSSLTGKPCEVAAISAALGESEGPVLLSFFCAGTPSQFATDQLIQGLDHDVESVVSTRYRGDGWPGNFMVSSSDGSRSTRSYEESWGEVLGRQLQGRCKICVDGTGESADISVGDYWASDEAGYPKFEDGDGRSVVIARTTRGMRVLEECVSSGLIELRAVSLDNVMKIQPLQVKRRLTLPGRLLGRLVTGQKVPRYRGYYLLPLFLRHIVPNLRAAAGTARRSIGIPRKTQ